MRHVVRLSGNSTESFAMPLPSVRADGVQDIMSLKFFRIAGCTNICPLTSPKLMVRLDRSEFRFRFGPPSGAMRPAGLSTLSIAVAVFEKLKLNEDVV